MVDSKLIEELKAMREKGASQASDSLKLYELAKQLAEESEDLKEELEDIDTIIVQIEITDADYKYWVKLGEGTVDYGEGVNDDATVTMKATGATWAAMSSGETDGTSAYMSGDLVIEGNLQDAIAFGEVTSIVGEESAHLFE